MKKILGKVRLWGLVAVAGSMMLSCQPDFVPDASLLPGTWCEGTEYYKYESEMHQITLNNGKVEDVNGSTWDIADDVTEAEGQPFRWELKMDNMTHIHIGEMGEKIPKTYIVTDLTANTLVYEDQYGVVHNFKRVK